MKSQAVLPLGAGIPGVSGEENVRAWPSSGALAKEPGVVPSPRVDGLWAPRRGSVGMVDLVLSKSGRVASRKERASRGPSGRLGVTPGQQPTLTTRRPANGVGFLLEGPGWK